MIRAVRANEPSFHDVRFDPGFNVVLADRTQESTKTDSRNGLGKSTLLEIIHFCLGASAKRDQGLLVEALKDWEFTLDFTVGERAISASRTTNEPTAVAVEGDFTGWPIQPTRNRDTGAMEFNLRQWSDLLGDLLFGLPVESEDRYTPGFRGLISFFVRRGRDSYSIPFETHRKQNEADKQVLNAFLLGLEWRDAADFQKLRERKKTLEDLQRAAKQGLVREFVGSLGELETLRVRLRDKAASEEEQIRTFRVHPQYEEIVRGADALTVRIHGFTNQNVVDRRYADLYRSTLTEERPPETSDVNALYREAGVVLPGAVVARLENVHTFHQQLVENRRQFLETEIARLDRAISDRNRSIEEMTAERASLLGILNTHGALAEYNRLNQLHLTTVAQLEDVERRIANLKSFEEGKSRVAIEQQTLLQRARRDVEERELARNEAIRLFNENSEALYSGAAGNLVIEVQAPTGFRFHVDIERSGSQGIDSMKVFCYDLTLAELWARRSPSPGFLIHDSTIFDGVDERQIALALELAARKSAEAGFQYICTLNSDTVPWNEFSEGFDLNSYVKLRLTDVSEEGRLLGIRF
ncbi:MAG: ABC-three component system protein [Candidatus Acidiferrales bacterium]